MKKKNYIKLIRVKHYIKNVLLFLPLVFSSNLFTNNIFNVLIGFASFSFMASVIYIINDLKDIESDRKHTFKKKRVLASGKVSKKCAIIMAIVLFIISVTLNYFATDNLLLSYLLLIGYFVLNIFYTYILKHIAILDVFCLMIFYIIRIYYGASLINIEVSSWLYLTAMAFSFYFALGKRNSDIVKSKETRKVLSYYNENFLSKYMNIMLGCGIIFYSLWASSINNGKFLFTVPLVIIILMKYGLNLDKNEDGDPIEVLLSDKIILALCILYAIIVVILMR